MKRLEDESFDKYKERRLEDNKSTEKNLKGKVVWTVAKGAYVNHYKPIRKALQEEKAAMKEERRKVKRAAK